jgi:hypothetical protein
MKLRSAVTTLGIVVATLPLLACGGGDDGPTAATQVEGIQLMSLRPSSGTVSIGSLNYRDCPQTGCMESLNVQFSALSMAGIEKARLSFYAYDGQRECMAAGHDVPAGEFRLVPGQPVAVTVYLIPVMCTPPFSIDTIRARVWDSTLRSWVLTGEWSAKLSFTK